MDYISSQYGKPRKLAGETTVCWLRGPRNIIQKNQHRNAQKILLPLPRIHQQTRMDITLAVLSKVDAVIFIKLGHLFTETSPLCKSLNTHIFWYILRCPYLLTYVLHDLPKLDKGAVVGQIHLAPHSMALCVARPSLTLMLAMHDKLVSVFDWGKYFIICTVSGLKNDCKWKYISKFPQMKSAQQGLHIQERMRAHHVSLDMSLTHRYTANTYLIHRGPVT